MEEEVVVQTLSGKRKKKDARTAAHLENEDNGDSRQRDNR